MQKEKGHRPTEKSKKEEKVEIMPATAGDRELARLEADAKLVEERFGDGEPYEFERVMRSAAAAKMQVADGTIELGRALIRIKANEEVENFGNALLKLDIARHSADLAMRLALKFGDTKRLKALPIRKLDMLAQLAEADIEKLDEKGKLNKGCLGSLNVEDVDRMTPAELRSLVKNLRNFKKKAEEQYHQVKRERDFLKDQQGVSDVFNRLTSAAGRSIASLQTLDLSEIEAEPLKRFVEQMRLALDALYKRACPEEAASMPDPDLELGKAERRARLERAGVAELKSTDEG